MPSKNKRVNLTLDDDLYALSSAVARLYGMPVSTFITTILRSSSHAFPSLIEVLNKKKKLDDVTSLEAIKIMPQFHIELGHQYGGATHTDAGEAGRGGVRHSDPRASNTGVALENKVKIVH